MGKRLTGFDYSRPLFYMVTIKCHAGRHGERWYPPRNKEALCAKGRMLFLSLWAPQAAKPDNATLYRRCHEMGDVLLGAKRLGTSNTLKSASPKGFAPTESASPKITSNTLKSASPKGFAPTKSLAPPKSFAPKKGDDE